MKRNIFRLLLVWSAIMAFLGGCATAPSEVPLSIAELAAQPDQFLGKPVTVQGYLGVDNLDVPHLYRSLEDAAAHKDLQAIDVVSDDRVTYKTMHFSKPGCAIVEGDFHIGGKDYIVTGSFVSEIGFIKVISFKKC